MLSVYDVFYCGLKFRKFSLIYFKVLLTLGTYTPRILQSPERGRIRKVIVFINISTASDMNQGGGDINIIINDKISGEYFFSLEIKSFVKCPAP